MQDDLVLATCANPSATGAQSELLMARLVRGGICEMVSPGAWSRALGYPAYELAGKCLREFMPLEVNAARELIADLLNPHADAPLDLLLRCKDQPARYFRFYRRFDERAETIFLVADALD